MKKIVLILILAALSLTASAQYVQVPTARRSGGSIKMADGHKLSKAEVNALLADIDGTDYTQQWYRSRGWRTAGIVMTSAGAGVAVGGAVTLVVGLVTSAIGAAAGATAGAIVGSIGGQETANEAANQGANQGAEAGTPIINAGIIVMGVGLATHVAGIPLIIVNSVKMSKIVDKYNEHAVRLQLGSTPSGVGLSLNF